MAPRGKILALPKDVRAWLDRALSDQGFGQYELLEELLRDRGFAISKSALHRYGQKLERRLAAVKASTDAMRLLDEAAGDERDSRSAGLLALIQTELFETIVNLQEATDETIDPAKRVQLLSNAAKNIATLTSSSVRLKRWQAEVQAATRAAAIATLDEASREARQAGEHGMSAERIMELRRKLASI